MWNWFLQWVLQNLLQLLVIISQGKFNFYKVTKLPILMIFVQIFSTTPWPNKYNHYPYLPQNEFIQPTMSEVFDQVQTLKVTKKIGISCSNLFCRMNYQISGFKSKGYKMKLINLYQTINIWTEKLAKYGKWFNFNLAATKIRYFLNSLTGKKINNSNKLYLSPTKIWCY